MKNKNKKSKYFSLMTAGRIAEIYIFGDIVSWEWMESDVSSYTLARTIQDLDVDQITVHINSYGGEVAEGLAIHNSLKNHPARVRTVCDGFACSAASVVFMAGDERIMNPASLLMIHNAWTYASGNAKALRKEADDLETISNASAETYRARVNISDEELTGMLDNETWITPANAVEWGFATEVLEDSPAESVSQSARLAVFQALTGASMTQGAADSKRDSRHWASPNDRSGGASAAQNLSTFLSALARGGKE